MAVSSYPTPADAGILCIILANTAISISIVKEIIQSILHNIGIHIESWEEVSIEHSTLSQHPKTPSESYMIEFRTRTPTHLYNSNFSCNCQDTECSICLTDFQPMAKINRLPCGHVFHKACIEKWLNYWNTTCPLCRDSLMPHGENQHELYI